MEKCIAHKDVDGIRNCERGGCNEVICPECDKIYDEYKDHRDMYDKFVEKLKYGLFEYPACMKPNRCMKHFLQVLKVQEKTIDLERNDALKSMLIMLVIYVIGIIFILADHAIIGFILAGGATFLKMSDVWDSTPNTTKKYNVSSTLTGYKVEEDNSMSWPLIIGSFLLGIIITPIFIIIKPINFVKVNKVYKYHHELENKIEELVHVTFKYDNKRKEWREEVV